jgi:hypothetical protein
MCSIVHWKVRIFLPLFLSCLEKMMHTVHSYSAVQASMILATFCCGSFLNTKTQRPVNIMYVSKLELSIIQSEESTLQDGNGSHHSQRKRHMNHRSSSAFFVSSKAPDASFSLQEFEKRKSGNMKMISWRLLPLKLTTTTLASSLQREWETGNQSFQSTRHLWFSLFEI